MTYPPGAKQHIPQLQAQAFVATDGVALPLRRWLPNTKPHAIIIAVHGFNDYSHFFEQPGQFLSQQGIACFAYDQRGFGQTAYRGLWAGSQAYRDDLQTLILLLKQHYPKQPLYLLGESMGGAVVLTTLRYKVLPVTGMILIAPAVWARSTMPWYQTSLLWTLAHTIPWLTLTGKGLGIKPSDNIDMLRALSADPWVIKQSRVETLFGLTNLMDEAFNSAAHLAVDTLLLYGEKDEIIPQKPTLKFIHTWLTNSTGHKTIGFYSQGYHMLLRDLQALQPWQDIVAWIKQPSAPLPSGADSRAQTLLIPSIAD